MDFKRLTPRFPRGLSGKIHYREDFSVPIRISEVSLGGLKVETHCLVPDGPIYLEVEYGEGIIKLCAQVVWRSENALGMSLIGEVPTLWEQVIHG